MSLLSKIIVRQISHFSTSIAWRYTRANKRSGLLSFLSTISMTGLVLGVSLLVIVLSVMNGFERELRERILGLVPQASLYRAGGIDNWRDLSASIAGFDGLDASAPFVQVSALLNFRRQTHPVLIYGIDVDQELALSNLSEFVDQSELDTFRDTSDSLLLGAELARELSVNKGASLMVLAPSETAGGNARVSYFRVAGLIRSNSELDQSLALANIGSLDVLRPASSRGKIDGLRLQFKDLNQAPWLASDLVFELGPQFYQSNWQRTHGNLYQAIKTSKTMVGLLMSMIVALASFNVVSTLILVVTEKQASIAILRTLGASSWDISGVFLVQGMIIGTSGVLLGVMLGVGVVQVLETAVSAIESTFQFQFLHSDVYPLTDIPAEIRASDIAQITLTAMGLVFAATVFPAWTASRLHPAEILRYE